MSTPAQQQIRKIENSKEREMELQESNSINVRKLPSAASSSIHHNLKP